MFTHSLNRYTAVPPIAAKHAQSDKKQKMSSLSSKTEKGHQPSPSSDLCVSGKGKTPNSVKHETSESPVTARSTVTTGTQKPDLEAADVEVNCSHVDGHCNGDAKAGATVNGIDDTLVQSSGEQSFVTTDDRPNASATVQESDNGAATAATNDDDNGPESVTSVSFICGVSV